MEYIIRHNQQMQLISTLRFLMSIIVLVPLMFYTDLYKQLPEIILLVIHFGNTV